MVRKATPTLHSYDHATGRSVKVHGNSHGGIYTNGQMPSKGIGRAKVEYNNDGLTTSQVLLQAGVGDWPAGAELHLVDLLISGTNSSTTSNTLFRFRDGIGGPIRYTFRHSTGAVGAPEHFESTHGYLEHPIYATAVYLEVVTLTLNLAINLHCYAASH